MYGFSSEFENNQKGLCAVCGKKMTLPIRYGDFHVCFDHSATELSKIQVDTEHYRKLVLRGRELEQQLKSIQQTEDLDKKLEHLEFLITNNKNEIGKKIESEFKSYEMKNNVDMANLQIEINKEIDKIKQTIESHQATTISLILKLNEAMGKQSESTNKIFQEIKQAINNNNNSPQLHKIETKLEELNAHIDGLGAYLDDINRGLKSGMVKLLTPKVPEPIKVEPKAREVVKETAKEEPKEEQSEKHEENIQNKETAIYEAFSTLRTIAEVAKITGINPRSVSRWAEKLENKGKIRSEGSNPRKYVHV